MSRLRMALATCWGTFSCLLKPTLLPVLCILEKTWCCCRCYFWHLSVSHLKVMLLRGDFASLSLCSQPILRQRNRTSPRSHLSSTQVGYFVFLFKWVGIFRTGNSVCLFSLSLDVWLRHDVNVLLLATPCLITPHIFAVTPWHSN